MIVGIAGRKGSGKNTAASELVSRGWTETSFAEPLKQMALVLNPLIEIPAKRKFIFTAPRPLKVLVETEGWDYVKRTYPAAREFLQKLGTDAVRDCLDENAWVDHMRRKLEGRLRFHDVVITDVRFENEAKLIRYLGGTLVYIYRPSVDGDNHPSETQHIERFCKYPIDNSGSVEQLQETLWELVKEVRGRTEYFLRGIDSRSKQNLI